MSDLLAILPKIKANPAMYLGKTSVSDLFMFLVGYECARSELGIDLTEAEETFYQDFQPWLQEKFKVQTVKSWSKIIMLNCADETTGFYRFFELLEQFFQLKKNKVLNINKSEIFNQNSTNELLQV